MIPKLPQRSGHNPQIARTHKVTTRGRRTARKSFCAPTVRKPRRIRQPSPQNRPNLSAGRSAGHCDGPAQYICVEVAPAKAPIRRAAASLWSDRLRAAGRTSVRAANRWGFYRASHGFHLQFVLINVPMRLWCQPFCTASRGFDLRWPGCICCQREKTLTMTAPIWQCHVTT